MCNCTVYKPAISSHHMLLQVKAGGWSADSEQEGFPELPDT